TSLIIYDTTDSSTVNPGGMVDFYANYSNATGEAINGTGTYCEIRFDISGWSVPVNMTYNETTEFYVYNRTISSAGIYGWEVLCNGSSLAYAEIQLQDTVTITAVAAAPAGGGGGRCNEDWQCTDWSECLPSGIQTRACSDLNNCGTITEKPEETRSCIYILEEEEEEEAELVERKRGVERSIYNATIYQDLELEEPEIEGVSSIKVNCDVVSEKIERLFRVKEVPVTNSNFTDFDMLIGVEANELLQCSLDIETEWLCAGFDYSLYKCRDWDFEAGLCRDDSSWEPILDMKPGLQKYIIHLEPGDPGLGIGPSPIRSYCGDGGCGYGESCSSCVADCGACVEQPTGIFARIISWFKVITGAAVAECNERWVCSDWTAYDEDGYRQRECSDTRNCGTYFSKPSDKEFCSYIDIGCSNGVLDQNEDDIDCGGVCDPCVKIPVKIISFAELLYLLAALIVIGVVVSYTRHEHLVHTEINKYALPVFKGVEQGAITPYSLASLINQGFGALFYYVTLGVEQGFEFLVESVVEVLKELEMMFGVLYVTTSFDIEHLLIGLETMSEDIFSIFEKGIHDAVELGRLVSEPFGYLFEIVCYVVFIVPKHVTKAIKGLLIGTVKIFQKLGGVSEAGFSGVEKGADVSVLFKMFGILVANIWALVILLFYTVPLRIVGIVKYSFVYGEYLLEGVEVITQVVFIAVDKVIYGMLVIANLVAEPFEYLWEFLVLLLYEVPVRIVSSISHGLRSRNKLKSAVKKQREKAVTKKVMMHHKAYHSLGYYIHKLFGGGLEAVHKVKLPKQKEREVVIKRQRLAELPKFYASEMEVIRHRKVKRFSLKKLVLWQYLSFIPKVIVRMFRILSIGINSIFAVRRVISIQKSKKIRKVMVHKHIYYHSAYHAYKLFSKIGKMMDQIAVGLKKEFLYLSHLIHKIFEREPRMEKMKKIEDTEFRAIYKEETEYLYKSKDKYEQYLEALDKKIGERMPIKRKFWRKPLPKYVEPEKKIATQIRETKYDRYLAQLDKEIGGNEEFIRKRLTKYRHNFTMRFVQELPVIKSVKRLDSRQIRSEAKAKKYGQYIKNIGNRIDNNEEHLRRKKINIIREYRRSYLQSMESLQRYIKDATNAGLAKSAIVINLVDRGWPKSLVVKKCKDVIIKKKAKSEPKAAVLNEYENVLDSRLVKILPETRKDITDFESLVSNVDRQIVSSIKKGMKKSEITKELMSKGVPKQVIDRHYNAIKKSEQVVKKEKDVDLGPGLSKFEKFILTAMADGKSKEEIKKMLLKRGWPKKFVNEHYDNLHREYEKLGLELGAQTPKGKKLDLVAHHIDKQLERINQKDL
ncbi:hypothetical protein KY337_03780, partial [Candidatus Woesearchaeota archaeon]|nr:hypothetical protein [Candidatus Woesearchaeota archaeon]